MISRPCPHCPPSTAAPSTISTTTTEVVLIPTLLPLLYLQVSFRSYWTRVLLEQLRNVKGDVSIKEMAEATMIRGQDIVDTLQSLGLIKYWKGTHLIHADPKVRAWRIGVGSRSWGPEKAWGARGEAEEDDVRHKVQRLGAFNGVDRTTTQSRGT